MVQYTDKEFFKRMVDEIGIEEAIKQKHRATGRTTRDILRLTLGLSEGKKVYIMSYPQPGKTRDHIQHVMRQVAHLIEFFNARHVCNFNSNGLTCIASGGVIRTITGNKAGLRLDGYEEYHLHDC